MPSHCRFYVPALPNILELFLVPCPPTMKNVLKNELNFNFLSFLFSCVFPHQTGEEEDVQLGSRHPLPSFWSAGSLPAARVHK